MNLEYFSRAVTAFDTTKVLGGHCTFTICSSNTNDPEHDEGCGDTRKVGTKDDGTEYMDETFASKCLDT